MRPDRFYVELERQTRLLAGAVHDVDLSRPVPTCPQWTVADLVDHVGIGHRWVAVMVERRASRPISKADADDRDIPGDPDARSAWLVAGARRLAGAVRDAGPDTTVWTWAPVKTAGFWLRRMLHDELVHRFDVELAAGRLGDVAPDLAADGVSDLLACIATLSPPDSRNPTFAGLAGAGETLQLQATDPGLAGAGEWLVERTPAGVTWRHGQAPADVTVRAPARELLLVLNRRLDPARHGVTVTGDEALFSHWLEHSRF
ncbi:MAG TPA: maleylpyruvate isomerase family mycothiol-dependent enzyme [Pseudonocardiaceae bacterium]|nr:maleylpyruvate isomerase family mycothiol-dependent enzyme [Pseudonocardiaceae bacterium]